jgi:hypothetical protein
MMRVVQRMKGSGSMMGCGGRGERRRRGRKGSRGLGSWDLAVQEVTRRRTREEVYRIGSVLVARSRRPCSGVECSAAAGKAVKGGKARAWGRGGEEPATGSGDWRAGRDGNSNQDFSPPRKVRRVTEDGRRRVFMTRRVGGSHWTFQLGRDGNGEEPGPGSRTARAAWIRCEKADMRYLWIRAAGSKHHCEKMAARVQVRGSRVKVEGCSFAR